MCGIVGVFGGNFDENKELFESLLWLDQLRGPHSTGVAFLNDKYTSVLKDDCTPEMLAYHKKWRKMMAKKHLGLLGHNRFATRGKVCAANAHPFTHGVITLAHNGSLNSWHGLPGHGKFETDSECIAHSINEIGIDKTWAKVDHNFNLGALVWWNAKEKSLNMINNGERPLTFSWLKDKDGIVFASESWMYVGLCQREKIERWKNEENIGIFLLEKNVFYSFTYDNKVVHMTARKLEKPVYVYNRGQSETPFQQRNWPNGGNFHPHIGPIANPPANQNKVKERLGGVVHGIPIGEFRLEFPFCIGCGHSLYDEFTSCYILDKNRRHALCEDCISGFMTSGIDFENKLRVV